MMAIRRSPAGGRQGVRRRPAASASMSFVSAAYEAGKKYGRRYEKEKQDSESVLMSMNVCWASWYGRKKPRLAGPRYHLTARSFVKGFCRGAGITYRSWVLLPTTRSITAILSVRNAEKTIGKVLDQLERLPLSEIIVVDNGSTDSTIQVIRDHTVYVKLVQYDIALGSDVGRAIGAEMAQSDILLFVEGDRVVQAEQWVPFLREIDRGSDMALNNLEPLTAGFHRRDPVLIVKEFVNRSLRRPDLGVNSLAVLPHALSRSAVRQIGSRHLAVPPMAQSIALVLGLKVTAPSSVNVFRGRRNSAYPSIELAIGDHLEALHAVMEQAGSRLYFQDKMRKREFAE